MYIGTRFDCQAKSECIEMKTHQHPFFSIALAALIHRVHSPRAPNSMLNRAWNSGRAQPRVLM
jgi:hypothetical protein